MTAPTLGTSRPRAATSVAHMMGTRPDLKSESTWSRSCCRLSPWIAEARNSRDIWYDSWSHMRLVEQKTMTRVPGGLERRIWDSRAYFSCWPPFMYLHKLCDGLVGDRPLLNAADKHVDRLVGHELRRNLLDLARPGGGEEERLPLWRNGAHDALDLWLEAHVEHAVRLVQHKVGYLTQLDLARFQEVIETAGRGDHNLHPVLDVPQLWPLGRAAIHTPATLFIADTMYLKGKGLLSRKSINNPELQTAYDE